MTISPAAHVRLEPDHQRVRERPRLAGDVPHLAQLHPHLLAHLAVHGLLHRLPRLHEPGDAAVHRHREGAAPSEQRLLAALDQGDDGGRQAREGQQATGGAAAGSLARRRFGGRAAPTAEPRGAVPLHELHRAPGERPAVVVDPSVQPHERHEAIDDDVRHPVAVEVDRPAGGAVEGAQHLARRLRGDVVGMLVQHAHLPLLDDDGDRTGPVVGQVEHRHEAGLGHVSTPPGSTRSVASWSDRTTATTPAAMSRPAGHAAAGGVSPKAMWAITVAPRISNRIATETSRRAQAPQHVVHERVARAAARRAPAPRWPATCPGRSR